MSMMELAAIAVGLVLGYLAVSKFLSGGSPGAATPADAPDRNDRTAESADAATAADTAAPPPSWPTILNVSPQATADEIRAAYESLLAKYHPEKVETLGEEFRDLAGRKREDITEAYRAAMRSRGIDA